MEIFAQIVTSFIAASGFGVLFGAPLRALFQCGFVGSSAWILYYFLTQNLFAAIPATIFAAILVSILSYTFAKIYKAPSIIFNVSGIIPLVPGGIAYNAMRNFVENDYGTAMELSAQVILIAGGIAIGLMFTEVMNQVGKKISARR